MVPFFGPGTLPGTICSMTSQRKLGQKKCILWLSADETSLSNERALRRLWGTLSRRSGDLLWGVLDLRHVFRAKKMLVFGAMEVITNDEYLARS